MNKDLLRETIIVLRDVQRDRNDWREHFRHSLLNKRMETLLCTLDFEIAKSDQSDRNEALRETAQSVVDHYKCCGDVGIGPAIERLREVLK